MAQSSHIDGQLVRMVSSAYGTIQRTRQTILAEPASSQGGTRSRRVGHRSPEVQRRADARGGALGRTRTEGAMRDHWGSCRGKSSIVFA